MSCSHMHRQQVGVPQVNWLQWHALRVRKFVRATRLVASARDMCDSVARCFCGPHTCTLNSERCALCCPADTTRAQAAAYFAKLNTSPHVSLCCGNLTVTTHHAVCKHAHASVQVCLAPAVSVALTVSAWIWLTSEYCVYWMAAASSVNCAPLLVNARLALATPAMILERIESSPNLRTHNEIRACACIHMQGSEVFMRRVQQSWRPCVRNILRASAWWCVG
jgi:hypothetical protein